MNRVQIPSKRFASMFPWTKNYEISYNSSTSTVLKLIWLLYVIKRLRRSGQRGQRQRRPTSVQLPRVGGPVITTLSQPHPLTPLINITLYTRYLCRSMLWYNLHPPSSEAAKQPDRQLNIYMLVAYCGVVSLFTISGVKRLLPNCNQRLWNAVRHCCEMIPKWIPSSNTQSTGSN